MVDEEESEVLRTVSDIDRYFAPFANCEYFCSDDSSRLAWVPRRAQAGHVFCVLLGAKVPHLLRLVADGQYKLIGECYLQDCMKGDVVETIHFAAREFGIV